MAESRETKVKYLPSAHKADYCDTCAQLKETISGIQTSFKRKRHTGSVEEEEQTRKLRESDIRTTKDTLAMHKEQAAKSRDFYNEMTARCKQQWAKIQELTDAQPDSESL